MFVRFRWLIFFYYWPAFGWRSLCSAATAFLSFLNISILFIGLFIYHNFLNLLLFILALSTCTLVKTNNRMIDPQNNQQHLLHLVYYDRGQTSISECA